MTTTIRAVLVLLATAIALPGWLAAHGSPTAWTAEATEYGCWVTRWLVRSSDGADSDAVVGVQVVLGRIIPPRGGQAQPGVTQAELDGATTVNVRLFDPSLADAATARVLRQRNDAVTLEKRPLDGEMAESPSFYGVGSDADSVLASLRAEEVTSVVILGADGTEVRFANTPEGLRVALAMYDACLGAKATSKNVT